MRSRDWSSDVCSSDLLLAGSHLTHPMNIHSSDHLLSCVLMNLMVRGAVGNRINCRFDLYEYRPLAGLFRRGSHVSDGAAAGISEARRAGQECVSTCSSRLLPFAFKKTYSTIIY